MQNGFPTAQSFFTGLLILCTCSLAQPIEAQIFSHPTRIFQENYLSFSAGLNTSLYAGAIENTVAPSFGFNFSVAYCTEDLFDFDFQIITRFSHLNDSLQLEKKLLSGQDINLTTFSLGAGWQISDDESSWIFIPSLGYGLHLFEESVESGSQVTGVTAVGHGWKAGFRLRYLLHYSTFGGFEDFLQFGTHWNQIRMPTSEALNGQSLDFFLEYGLSF